MRSSLIFKLLGAFLLVIATGAVVNSWLTSRAMNDAFSLYSTRNSQAWADQLAPVLADFYLQNKSWSGVEAALQSGLSSPAAPGQAGGQGRGFGQGRQGSQWTANQRVVLADEQGVVIYDSAGEMVGHQLSTAELSSGAPVMVESSLVGTVLVTPNNLTGASSPAGQFLASVNQSIIISAVIAGAVSLLFGAILFLYVIAPLRQLNRAAGAISRGDLSQRVDIRSKDELGELSQTFNQMAESLDRAETQRKHLIADVAHELRTPIAVIQANLEAMLDGVLPLDGEQVAALHDETLLLKRLVGDLRLLSLADAGELKLERKSTGIESLIHQVVDRLTVQAQQNGIVLEEQVAKDLPPVMIDQGRITQVLNNLLGNALRYTPQAGKISINARLSPTTRGLVEVSVTDTGPGIDPADLPYIFDRFYRADPSRQHASGGSGLGLAIVKQLVEAHGGKVNALSPAFSSAGQPGYGTRLTFTLPTTRD
jgi:two-component system OmpR family sensor kinase